MRGCEATAGWRSNRHRVQGSQIGHRLAAARSQRWSAGAACAAASRACCRAQAGHPPAVGGHKATCAPRTRRVSASQSRPSSPRTISLAPPSHDPATGPQCFGIEPRRIGAVAPGLGRHAGSPRAGFGPVDPAKPRRPGARSGAEEVLHRIGTDKHHQRLLRQLPPRRLHRRQIARRCDADQR
jgi:hypothetical protein